MTGLLTDDLLFIVKSTKDVFRDLNGKRILLTGGTGFFGKWLLETFSAVLKEIPNTMHVYILSRNPEKFKTTCPHLYQNRNFTFLKGDITDFTFTGIEADYIIHAATEASARLNHERPLIMINTIVDGTRNVLEFARRQQVERMLFISSGAVYGILPEDQKGFSEDFIGGPDPLVPSSAYAEAKRMAELLCACYGVEHKIEIPVARCFAFVGPYMELDAHFAIGNFIRNGLKGENIVINGDGKPLRSYMYAADLVIWLLHILLLGKSGDAYNVGSDEIVSIRELACMVASFFPGLEVQVRNEVHPTDRNQHYVPDIQKSMNTFMLQKPITLHESLERTIQFYK